MAGGTGCSTMPDIEELPGGSPVGVSDAPEQGELEASGVDTAVDQQEIPSADELRDIMGLPKTGTLAESPDAPDTTGDTGQETGETDAETTDQGTKGLKDQGTEAGAEPEAGVKPDTDAETETKPEPKAETPEFQKRIDELTAARKSAEEKAAALEAENEELRKSGVKPDPQAEALARSPDYYGLSAEELTEVKRHERVRAWALENPEGGELPGPDGKPEFISAARVQAALSESSASLATVKVMSRQRFQQAQAQTDEYVKQVYPELADPRSEDAKAMERTFQALPELRTRPDAKVWIGRLFRGFHAEQEDIKKRQAAATAPAAKPAALPRAPAAGVVPRAASIRTQPPASRRDEHLAALRLRAAKGDKAAQEEYFAETG